MKLLDWLLVDADGETRLATLGAAACGLVVLFAFSCVKPTLLYSVTFYVYPADFQKRI